MVPTHRETNPLGPVEVRICRESHPEPGAHFMDMAATMTAGAVMANLWPLSGRARGWDVLDQVDHPRRPAWAVT